MLNNNTSRTGKQRERVPSCAPSAGDEHGAAACHATPAARGRRPLSTAHIRPRLVYVAGASLFTATHGRECAQVGGGKRGQVKGFSKDSRLRLMRLIGSIRKDAELPCFVTLTYPSEFPTVARAKRDLKVFIQCLRRQFPGAGYIWKLEPQERGAPHYHMLVWGVPEGELLVWVVKEWFRIAGNGDRNHMLFHLGMLHDSKPCVQRVRSFRGVWSYASKYLGKTFEVAEWGSTWTGRFWGVGNRPGIPFGEVIEVSLDPSSISHIMRYQRRYSGVRQRPGVNSCTIFCNADQWMNKLACEYARSRIHKRE